MNFSFPRQHEQGNIYKYSNLASARLTETWKNDRDTETWKDDRLLTWGKSTGDRQLRGASFSSNENTRTDLGESHDRPCDYRARALAKVGENYGTSFARP
jgi:hypothetical protein